MSETPALRAESVRHVLQRLSGVTDGERPVILIGGQSVSLWMALLEDMGMPNLDEGLLASKDIDFAATSRAVEQCAIRLGGTARLAGLDDHTANSGLVMFVDDDGITRQIDFLWSAYGIHDEDLLRTAQSIELVDEAGTRFGVWLMHPERCLESRAHNIVGLDRTSEISMNQLRASIVCAREFSRRVLLDSPDLSPERAVREVLNLNERIFRFAYRNKRARRLYAEYNIDVSEAILTDDSRLPEKFLTVRYPQMRRHLEERRRTGGGSTG